MEVTEAKEPIEKKQAIEKGEGQSQKKPKTKTTWGRGRHPALATCRQAAVLSSN